MAYISTTTPVFVGLAEKANPDSYTGVVYSTVDPNGNRWYLAGYRYRGDPELTVVDRGLWHRTKDKARELARHKAQEARIRKGVDPRGNT